jgi:hypothetical protein
VVDLLELDEDIAVGMEKEGKMNVTCLSEPILSTKTCKNVI